MRETCAARSSSAEARRRRPRLERGSDLVMQPQVQPCARKQLARLRQRARLADHHDMVEPPGLVPAGIAPRRSLRLCCITQAPRRSAMRITLASVPCTARSRKRTGVVGQGADGIQEHDAAHARPLHAKRRQDLENLRHGIANAGGAHPRLELVARCVRGVQPGHRIDDGGRLERCRAQQTAAPRSARCAPPGHGRWAPPHRHSHRPAPAATCRRHCSRPRARVASARSAAPGAATVVGATERCRRPLSRPPGPWAVRARPAPRRPRR